MDARPGLRSAGREADSAAGRGWRCDHPAAAATARCDLYSLCCVLHECLTGGLPGLPAEVRAGVSSLLCGHTRSGLGAELAMLRLL